MTKCTVYASPREGGPLLNHVAAAPEAAATSLGVANHLSPLTLVELVLGNLFEKTLTSDLKELGHSGFVPVILGKRLRDDSLLKPI